MGKASRLHKQAVIAGTEAPIRHEKWKPEVRYFLLPKGIKRPRIVKPVTAEKLAELKEGAPNVSE